jgi:glyoxylase-like metal-dependent hydrolase (beta-lactamase superfamily II)
MPVTSRRIALPTPFPVGPVNVWVLLGEPLTLIDAGPRTPEALAALERGLCELRLRIEDVELLVLTHQHHDHVGQAGLIRERAGCAVAAHELLVKRLADLRAAQVAEDRYAEKLMRLHGVPETARAGMLEVYRRRRPFAAPVDVDVPLRHGEDLRAGGRTLRIAFRPGHSPSDTLLIDDASRCAFVGDHLLARISSNPLVHLPLEGGADPRERRSSLLAYLESLEHTAGEEHEVLLPGHGEEILDHRALAARRVRLHRLRAEQVFRELAAEPRTAGAIARALWPEADVSQTFLALCEVIGALDLLAADDRVTCYEERGALVFAAARGRGQAGSAAAQPAAGAPSPGSQTPSTGR